MVIVRIWEGLGNQMFQYAYARALKEKGILVRLDMNKAYDECFDKFHQHECRENSIQNFKLGIKSIDVQEDGRFFFLKRDNVWEQFIFWLSQNSLWPYRFYEEERQEYSEASEKVRGNCYVKGWFQSEKYFSDIREILLKEFTPKNKIKLSKYLRSVLDREETVSIHVRRGDYVKISNALGELYYQRAIEYIKAIYRNPTFLVFSDDIEWARDNIIVAEEVLYVNEDGKLKDYEELLIMSKCKSNIIANSTFSWWAAWLNQNDNKHVIAPRKWFPSQGGIVPEEWTII